MKNVLRMVGRIFGCARGHDSGTRLAHSHLTSCEARRAMLRFDCLLKSGKAICSVAYQNCANVERFKKSVGESRNYLTKMGKELVPLFLGLVGLWHWGGVKESELRWSSRCWWNSRKMRF